MRILSIGNFTTGWDGSICDEEHIAGALEQLGHEVIRLQREEANSDISNINCDFVLVAQWDGYGDLFRVTPRPMVYWAFDYQADGQEWHERLVTESDLYLSKRIADSKYPNWQWLPQDFAPKFLDKHPETVEQDIDVLFTGSYLPWATERNETLKAVDEKFNLVIHSVNKWPGFKDVRPPILDDGLPQLYARAKVILSIDHTIKAGYWSDRNAQIMCCGFKPLFRYVPLSENTFHDHVNYFYSIEHCLGFIDADLGIRKYGLKEYSDSAYEYAKKNLTVTARVKDLLTIVQGIL